MQNLSEWKNKPKKSAGILCACDALQEWLLPWWWERYHAVNDLPVAFIDLGMSAQARTWCQERGELFSLKATFSVTPKEDIPSELVQKWEGFYGPTLWKARPSWFKKPFACLQSPFQKTLWIDLDCEVLGPIDEILDQCDPSSELALVREHTTEHLPRFHPDVRYNGGVITFIHGAKIIIQWAQEAVQNNHCFWSDDALLSALIHGNRLAVVELSELYNWRLAKGININAVIHHWVGSAGKSYIKKYGGIKNQFENFFKTI